MRTNRIALLPCLAFLLTIGPAGADGDVETWRAWVQDMKEAERGPFQRLRWFCEDGTVLPPKAYACADHGGGVQHGQWSERTETLRDNGYYVANLLAGMDAEEWLAAEDSRDRYAQLLIERFLVGADDGWIFRRALFYRGAIQEEDEREGARRLLTTMATDPWWSGPAFAAWRTGARLLPHGQDNASIDRVRQLSATLSDRDAGFRSLRAKIHGAPDAGDAQRVRDYAAGIADAERAAAYERLATEIDAVYTAPPLGDQLAAFLDRQPPAALADAVRRAAGNLEDGSGTLVQLQVAGQLLADLFGAIRATDDAGWRLAALDLGLAVERDFFTQAAALRTDLPRMSRQQHLSALRAAGQAAYGAGLLNERLHGEMSRELDRLLADEVSLADYRAVLTYLGRAPGWGTQGMRMHFFDSMQKLAQLEPIALRFVQDQLRASPLLLFADVLNALSTDAGRLAGVRHRFFGEDAGAAFTALNPGLARGVLHVAPDVEDVEDFEPDGIYVLPETVSDLPPVRGILTAGEGNPLSHVQLLARNLGIPNTTVNEQFLPRLSAHDGERVVLAISPSGLVEMAADDARWDEAFGSDEEAGGAMIRPDLDKLRLDVQRFLPLDELRAEDSGRTVGPKAAKLGELRHHYPEAVGNGVAIPFGLFRAVALEQPHPGGGTVREWMVRQYRELGPMDPMDREQAERYEAFRAELYDLILEAPIDAEFRQNLRNTLREAFGAEQVPGLFVRSDTNVEDLAGFTGAGLNLTLPNVVGEDNLIAAIRRVWASPFTARAFAWRQSHMSEPEHVYTSILLLESQPSDKSGVLVTQDIDSGDRGTLSVAVNEGVGGAVDGQAAESLRIDRASGGVRVLATATAPTRRQPNPAGGLQELPVSGTTAVLKPDEVRQLIAFADSLPDRFPPITDDDGNTTAADVEFGFIDGRLRLYQLRPFLESRSARGSGYLASMDATLADTDRVRVNMSEVPQS